MPNIFDDGGSELSQDAVLAYLIKWAKPEFATENPEMHALGRQFLLALLNCARQAEGRAACPTDFRIENLTLKKQHKVTLPNGRRGLIDLLVVINEVTYLIIEDKVGALEAPNQIAGYRTALHRLDLQDISAVYVKTGNETPPYVKTGNETRPRAHPLFGRFMRLDILAALAGPLPDDCIVRQFREYLNHKENNLASFQTAHPRDWSGDAIEGFLGWVTILLHNLQVNDAEWSWQYNPRGGEWVCAWNWLPYQGPMHLLYLQTTHTLSGPPRLHVRIQSNQFPADRQALRDAVTNARNTLLAEHLQPQLPEMTRHRGRWNGRGQSGQVVELRFAAHNAYGWLPLTPEGLVDLAATQQRLSAASAFLSAAIR